MGCVIGGATDYATDYISTWSVFFLFFQNFCSGIGGIADMGLCMYVFDIRTLLY